MSDDSDPEDPLDRLDEVADPEGDPFESLDSPADDERTTSADEADGPRLDEDPFSTPASAPDAARSVDREGDPFEDFPEVPEEGDPESLFAGAAVSDDDSVWDDLSEAAADGVRTEQRGQRRYAEVSKYAFCLACEHFSAPPDVRCTHEGTEILTFLDMETVRVVDCPVVAEREAIADEE